MRKTTVMNDEITPRQSSATFEYLIANDNDLRFNAVVKAIGSQRIAPHSEYPLKVHPADYFFDPAKGRVLHEWQLLYITQGEGEFRSTDTHPIAIDKGTIILLRRQLPFLSAGARRDGSNTISDSQAKRSTGCCVC